MTTPKWWVIHELAILDALRKVERGESADLVMSELLANTESESEEVE